MSSLSSPAAVTTFLDDLALDVTLTRLHEAEALDYAREFESEFSNAVCQTCLGFIRRNGTCDCPAAPPEDRIGMWAVTVIYEARSYGTEAQYREFELDAPDQETAEERATALMEASGDASEIIQAHATLIGNGAA